MPELPEVETIKNAIANSIGKCVIKDLIIRNNHLRTLIPADIKDKTVGAKINGYRRRAKYIIIDLDNGYSLIWHMGMSGRIKISDEQPNPPEKHDHILMSTANGWLTYNDARRFGLFTYVKTADWEKSSLFANIGFEPFDEKLTAEILYTKLQKKKIPIKEALLDQKIITGIGNIYASESLYKARILPTREADKVTKEECRVLLQAVREVLQQAIKAGGSTLRDYKKPDGSLGYFQNLHCVYNKTGQKCPDCTCDINQTGGIKKIVQAGRSSFFCPIKQK